MFAAARWFVLGLGSFVILGCAEGAENDAAPMPGAPTVTVLAQGPPVRGTNGITLGPDGRLWIASLSTPALAAMDPEKRLMYESF